MVSHWCFDSIVLSCIVVNSMLIGVEVQLSASDPDGSHTDVFEVGSQVFGIFFTFELLIRLAAEGPVRFIRDAWNLFEGVIVSLSVAEAVINFVVTSSDDASGIATLRVLRLVRVTRLYRVLRTTRITRCTAALRVLHRSPVSSQTSK